VSHSEKGIYAILAEALHYPCPGLAANLVAGIQVFPEGAARKAFEKFVQAIQDLALGEWEELYTRTLDLSPAVAPYLGYQLWGDGYPRGAFMAALNRAYQVSGIEMEGELPDHLRVVLTYLDTGSLPPSELVDAFEPAVQKMLATLQKGETDNPYVYLLESAAQAVDLKTVQNEIAAS
jgi:nitrate reductase molybdenum cofactor assembly chaperone NarJ/NarW